MTTKVQVKHVADADTNREGMTWQEWRNAAAAWGAVPQLGWIVAWVNGCDPTEFASEVDASLCATSKGERDGA